MNNLWMLRHLLVSFQTTESIGAPRSLARIICYLREFTVSVRLASAWLLNTMVSQKNCAPIKCEPPFSQFFALSLPFLYRFIDELRKCITSAKNEEYILLMRNTYLDTILFSGHKLNSMCQG